MGKVKEVCKLLFWPILFGIGQFFICGIFVYIYMTENPENFNNTNLLVDYINHQTIWIIFLECIIFVPLFLSVYRKYQLEKIRCTPQNIMCIGTIAVVLSTVLNFIIIWFRHILYIPMETNTITFSTLLATGILGPILEELLFRGIVYGGFSSIFHKRTSFYFSIFVFGIFHMGGLFQILFALIIGYYLTRIYVKKQDIRLCIMAHILVNTTSILGAPFLLSLF